MKEFNRYDIFADDCIQLLILFLVYYSPFTYLAWREVHSC